MIATVELSDAELADLRELTHAADAQSAVRSALDEYRRYARRMLLKDLTGMPAKPTREHLQAVIHAICKRIAQIPCFHVFENFIAHRFSDNKTEIALRAITRNAALESALINLRSFNEFFASGRGGDDDVRASDFPGVSMKPFLAKVDVTAIHKYLAHITTVCADIVTKDWPLDKMVLLGLQHGVKFLSTIETTFPPATETTLAELRGIRDVISRFISEIKNRNEPTTN